jgi:hypothetical protein
VSAFTESVVEDAALAWLESLGYATRSGPAIAVGEPGAERSDQGYRDMVLERRLREALVALNPGLPPEALGDAYRKLTRVDVPTLVARNRALHQMLVDGVQVEYQAHPAQARLPAGQAGEGNPDRARAGRGAVGAVGERGGLRRRPGHGHLPRAPTGRYRRRVL